MKELRWGMNAEQARVWQQEYQAGYDAFERGLLYNQCPHPQGVRQDGWRRGWSTAEQNRRMFKRIQ